MVPWIESEELLDRLGDDEVLVVDLRDDQQRQISPQRIPGALRMTVSEMAQSSHILPDDELIVLYGDDDSPESADVRRVYRLLRGEGRHPVFLRGGLRGWIRSGGPIEREAQLASGME